MATLLRTTGQQEPLTPGDAVEGFSLEELYAALGCTTVEALALPGGGWLVLDEDGKFTTKPRNEAATDVARTAGIAPDDYVVGDALVCGREELR